MNKRTKRIVLWTVGIIGAIILAGIAIFVADDLLGDASKGVGKLFGGNSSGSKLASGHKLLGAGSSGAHKSIASVNVGHHINSVHYSNAGISIANAISNVVMFYPDIVYIPSQYRKKKNDEPVRYKPYFKEDKLKL